MSEPKCKCESKIPTDKPLGGMVCLGCGNDLDVLDVLCLLTDD